MNALGEEILSNVNTVKSPKFMPSFKMSKGIHWARSESLVGRFWHPGLMLGNPVLVSGLRCITAFPLTRGWCLMYNCFHEFSLVELMENKNALRSGVPAHFISRYNNS